MVNLAASAVQEIFGATLDRTSYFDCDHNHVQHEAHDGRLTWVHRKGANSAAAGERGIIPGSMGTESFHVEGRGNREALCSSSHGAGREMSREEARRRISARQLESELSGTLWDRSGARDLREEAPAAYKDVREVLRAQKELVKQVRRLRPILSYKG
jgi:tRNA-splicing ligase RtcB